MSTDVQDVEQLEAALSGEVGRLLPLNSSSLAYEASRRVKSGEGLLVGFSGYNSKASAQFIQVHDAQTLPADGAVPDFVMTVAASSNFSVLWIAPRSFTQGCFLCNSSTGPTKTIGSADCWFDAQYV